MSTYEADVRRQAIDPDRLLPGEHPESDQPGDARHWVEVYTQLIEAKGRIVVKLRELMARQGKDAREELERADLNLLELEIQRFHHRRAIWEGKAVAHRDHS